MSTTCPPPIHPLSVPLAPWRTGQLDGGEPLGVAATVADHPATLADLEALAADARAQLEASTLRWMVNLDESMMIIVIFADFWWYLKFSILHP